MSTLPLADIKVGDRARKDMGDIEALARSIQEHGLLHPVVVLRDGTLVAGGRRLAAAGMLGMEEVPVTVVDVADLLSAERDENEVRKNLTPTEAVSLGRLIEEQHRATLPSKTEIARNAGLASQAKRRGEAREVIVQRAQPSREVAAAAVGMSGKTYHYAKKVVEAAEADPEAFGDLPARMDETGQVEGAHNELVRRKTNGEAARSAVHYKAQYPKPNREMERGLITLEGLISGFGLIDLDQLDSTKTEEWGKRLKAAASFLSRLSQKVGRKNV